MGQVASAADNAAMEPVFSLLQKNVLDRRPWRTREQLRIRIVTCTERTYHRRRRQLTTRNRRTDRAPPRRLR
jgi:putative transposase